MGMVEELFMVRGCDKENQVRRLLGYEAMAIGTLELCQRDEAERLKFCSAGSQVLILEFL